MAFRKNEEHFEFEGTVEARTEKAILFWRSGDEAPTWLPKSQAEIVHPSGNGHPAVVRMSAWITKQKGWEE